MRAMFWGREWVTGDGFWEGWLRRAGAAEGTAGQQTGQAVAWASVLFQGCPDLTRALAMVSSLCMHAVMTT